MKPAAFFDFAEWALQHNPTPAGFRSVTSRAYYAAIHRAVEFLAAFDIRLPPDVSIHARVPDILDDARDPEIEEIAVWLRTLRGQRNEADYDLDKPFVEASGFATARLLDARKIIARLNTVALGKGQPGSWFEGMRGVLVASAKFLTEGPGNS